MTGRRIDCTAPRHIFKVVIRKGVPVLVCIHCPKEVP